MRSDRTNSSDSNVMSQCIQCIMQQWCRCADGTDILYGEWNLTLGKVITKQFCCRKSKSYIVVVSSVALEDTAK